MCPGVQNLHCAHNVQPTSPLNARLDARHQKHCSNKTNFGAHALYHRSSGLYTNAIAFRLTNHATIQGKQTQFQSSNPNETDSAEWDMQEMN